MAKGDVKNPDTDKRVDNKSGNQGRSGGNQGSQGSSGNKK
jgi:hypothetical protein